MRIKVRVKPGASRTKVGGRYGEDSLVVAVTAKAVDGAATEAVLRAVAEALGVPRGFLCVVFGAMWGDRVWGGAGHPPAAAAELVRHVEQLTGPRC